MVTNLISFSKKNQPDLINRGVNGQVVNGKIDESPNVAEVNMESFKCDFPSLNGRISHNFHVKDLTSNGRADLNFQAKKADGANGFVADVARFQHANLDKPKSVTSFNGTSSYANALGASCGDGIQAPSSRTVALQYIKPNER